MIRFLLLLAFSFSAAPFFSFGQTVDTVKTLRRTDVTKGYYAIGDNVQKLNRVKPPLVPATSAPETKKGYRSINAPVKKSAALRVVVGRPGTRPVTGKGYYSISTGKN